MPATMSGQRRGFSRRLHAAASAAGIAFHQHGKRPACREIG